MLNKIRLTCNDGDLIVATFSITAKCTTYGKYEKEPMRASENKQMICHNVLPCVVLKNSIAYIVNYCMVTALSCEVVGSNCGLYCAN